MLKIPDAITKERLDLADFIENRIPPGNHYNQQYYFSYYHCSRCICGWQNWRKGRQNAESCQAGQDLGLDPVTAARLFQSGAGNHPSKEKAAQCLRHLAVTGELPDWW